MELSVAQTKSKVLTTMFRVLIIELMENRIMLWETETMLKGTKMKSKDTVTMLEAATIKSKVEKK